MSITKEKKGEIIEMFKKHDGDTGSPEVQIAILTERISNLTFQDQQAGPPLEARLVEARRSEKTVA